MWNKVDAFQFVWRRLSGDAALSADIEFLGTSAANHRKAVLMFRQSLDPDAAYADIAVHGFPVPGFRQGSLERFTAAAGPARLPGPQRFRRPCRSAGARRRLR